MATWQQFFPILAQLLLRTILSLCSSDSLAVQFVAHRRATSLVGIREVRDKMSFKGVIGAALFRPLRYGVFKTYKDSVDHCDDLLFVVAGWWVEAFL